MTAQPQTSTSPGAESTEAPRLCVACDYNLFGLGDEPRCPECGLLNIPEEHRRQVWELVDSKKRFFSGMFSPLQKRLPGWWWALDREGDVRRSVLVAAQNILIAACIIMTATAIANACVVELTTHLASFETGNLTGRPINASTWVQPIGLAFTRTHDPALLRVPDRKGLYGEGRTVQRRISRRLVFAPSWHGAAWGAGLVFWVLLLWAGPALAGLYTQLRKGLPEFARAPRTIIAAANYESYRLVYVSVFITLCLGVEIAVRWNVWFTSAWQIQCYMLMACLLIAIGAFGAAGWIGPLRSDYTKQLVQSRLHATRIIVMYAIILPWAFTLAIISMINVLW